MRIAYNGSYREAATSGGNAHIGQFIDNVTSLGHEILTWPGSEHPAARVIGHTRLEKLRNLRRVDALYFRVEWSLPHLHHLMHAPIRQLIGSPRIVWEFNTGPAYGSVAGHSHEDVRRQVENLRRYGKRCDLAICVSSTLAAYVQQELGIKTVLVVPNGSDPDLFKPGVSPVEQVTRRPEGLNVAWIGSADIPWHNFELLKGAAKLLWERDRSRITFHCIGHGLSGRGDMPPNVKYHGAQRYRDLPHWLAPMDVGLCLYRPGAADFGSPLKAFDYMSSGLVVVGTLHPQLRELFEQLGQADLLLPPDDPQVLADTLSRLAGDAARLLAQGAAGRRLVVEHYNWARAARDTIRGIEQVL